MTPMDVSARIDRLRAKFAAEGIDGLLISKPVNIRWATGFTGSNAKVIITADRFVLVTDGRYDEQARIETAAAGVAPHIEIARDPTEVLASVAASVAALGVESHHLTIDQHTSFVDAFATVLHPVGGLVDYERQVKDPGEQDRLRAAAAIADRALSELLPVVLAGGLSEREFARSLDTRMLELGADAISFETIVAAGANSSRPHHRPTEQRIEPGDLVVIDFGASIDGYGSDMTRTIACGGKPTTAQSDLYESVAASQSAGVEAVCDGVEQASIDAACRSVLDEAGLGEAFVHGTGHGIGLEIHEQPILSRHSVGILRADLVITVEPGAYLPGFGGVRVEDSVVVTSSGCDPITLCPKGLVPA